MPLFGTGKRTSEGPSDEERALKRRAVSNYERFFFDFCTGEMNTGNESKVLKFTSFIADTFTSSIFERDCFEPLTRQVKDNLALSGSNGPAYSSVIVTGTSGVGKTFYGFYLARKLVEEGCVVAFNYRNIEHAILAPPRSKLATKDPELHRLLESCGLQLDETRNFSGVIAKNRKGDDLWQAVINTKSTWLIVDLHRGNEYRDLRPLCNVVVTSILRSGDWPTMLNSGGDRMSCKLYMGPLSLEEAKLINVAAGLNHDEADIEERFKLFGGSARLLFNETQVAQQKIDEAFQTGHGTAVDPEGDNPTMTSLLVHILADTNFARRGKKFASMTIATRCVDAIIANRTLREEIWQEATQGKCGYDIISARGVFAERLWHRAVKGAHKIRVKMLDVEKTTEGELMMLKKAFTRTRILYKLDMSDLTDLGAGDYVQPDTGVDFPAIDSFAVLDSPPWTAIDMTDDEEDCDHEAAGEKFTSAKDAHGTQVRGPIGIMFQMTVSRHKHKLPQGNTIKNVDKKMGELVEGFETGKSPLYLVFVTDSADGYQWHNYRKPDGKAYKSALPKELARIQQVAISFRPVPFLTS